MRHYPKPSATTLPQTLILANGAFPTDELSLSLLSAWSRGEWDGVLVCCDGAVNKLTCYTDRLPDAVVGDLDSVSASLRAQLSGRIHHFPDQETNDLTKTMRYVSTELGLRAVTLLGASGGREDHLLGNLSLLPTYTTLVDELVMLTDTGYFRLVAEPSSVEVEVGQQVSVFSFEQAEVTLRGVHWALDADRLPQLWCGTLNRAIETRVELASSAPLLLYVAHR